MSIFKVNDFVDIAGTPHIAFDDIPDVSPISVVISLSAALFLVLILEPLKLGAKSWYYQLTDGKSLPVNELFGFFFGFGRYFKAVYLTVSLFIKKLLWSIVFLSLPIAAIVGGFVWRERASRDIELLLSHGLRISGIALLLIMSLLLAVWLNRYYLAEYIFVSEDKISPRRAVRLSVMLTKGRRWEFFMLELSFLGWRILNIAILPMLYSVPYISVVKSLYTRYLLELFAREQSKAEQQSAVCEPSAPESKTVSADDPSSNQPLADTAAEEE